MSSEILKIVDAVTLFCSFSGNIYIVTVNALGWIQRKRLHVSDQFTGGTAFFQALYEALKASGYVLELPVIGVQADLRASLAVNLSILSCSFWVSTWLCVNLCLKIVNLRQGFYISLQKAFSRALTWWLLLFLCLAASVLLSSAVGLGVSVQPLLNSSLGPPDGNVSAISGPHCPLACQIFFCESVLGFLLSSASLVAIIASLYRHVKKMRSAEGEFRNVGVHTRAVRTVSFLLLGNVIFFPSVLVTLLKGSDRSWRFYISIATSMCHFFIALNAINGNGRLMEPIAKVVSLFPFQRRNENAV